MRRHAPKKSFLNEETRSLTTNAVGIRRQAGRGRRPGGARTERATAAPSRQPIADRGYDHEKYRRLGIRPVIARRQTEHGSGLGRYRCVVELTLPGYTTSNGCSSATNAATTSTTLCSRSAAASSASDDSGSQPEMTT